MTTLVVTNSQIAAALNVADSTFRCFRLLSAPQALPWIKIPSDHPSGRQSQRGYLLDAVSNWVKRAAPERSGPEFERKLYAFAAQNVAKMEPKNA